MGIRTITITDPTGNIVTLNNSKANPVCNMGQNEPQQKIDNAPKDAA